MDSNEHIIRAHEELLKEHKQLCRALKNAYSLAYELTGIDSQDFAESIGITLEELSRWTSPTRNFKQ